MLRSLPLTFLAILALGLPTLRAQTNATATDPKWVMVADFEGGTDGFTGNIEADSGQAHTGTGSGRIEAELAEVEESPWKTTSTKLELPGRIEAVRFWIKSAEAKGIALRLTDSTGQAHMVRPRLTPGDDWQEVEVVDFEAGPGHQTYGGEGDGKVHWPATQLDFVVEKGQLIDGRGVVWLDGVEVLPAENP